MSIYWWVLPACVLGLLAILNRKVNRKRSQCIALLNARPDACLSEEYDFVARKGSMPASDVERLWTALAAEYGVPVARIRATDRLHYELEGIHHPDHDPFLSSLFMSRTPKEVMARFDKVNDWADFIVAIYSFEREVEKQATTPVNKEGVIVHKWAD